MGINQTDVTQLSYEELNNALLECDDVERLKKWLDITVASGVGYRARRVHGRLNAVRRAQEAVGIEKKSRAAKKARAKEAA